MKSSKSVFPYEGVNGNLLNPKESLCVAWVVIEVLTFGVVDRSVFDSVVSNKFLNPRSVELPIPLKFFFKGDFVLGKISCICHYVYKLPQKWINVNTFKKIIENNFIKMQTA